MKFTSTVIVALASAVAATPVLNARQQNAVSTSIQQWFNDIQAVNNFLNNVAFSGTPSADAGPILQIAQDEPNQLTTLTGLINDPNGQQNSANLMQNFPTVPAALTNIINANNDPNIVRANVAVINSIRCGTVLQNIGGLWENALTDNGLAVVAFPPGPNVCPTADGNGIYAVVAPLLQ